MRDLPPGVCPLFFPVLIEPAESRHRIYADLRGRGVITHPWWDRFHPSVPWEDFPDAVSLKTKLLGLPVHQDLRQEHLGQIVREFRDSYAVRTRQP